MIYLEFNDGDYTQLRKDLIRNKGSELQKGLLEAAKDSKAFIQWIEQNVNLETEGEKFDLWSDKLSEDEYKNPPGNVEKKLFKICEGLTPAQASHETFWGYVTLGHINQGIIESSYLAASARSPLSGLGRIEQALSSNQEKPIDDVVRSILLRLSGLPEARGYRSVYVNCPFARAWWRVYIAHQVCDETGADFDRVFKTLRSSSQEYWELLINLIVSRYAVLGSTRVRSTLIWVLCEWEEDRTLRSRIIQQISRSMRQEKELKKPETLGRIIQQISIRTAWQELGVLTVEELKPIIEEIISGVLSSRT